jgi:hypothetical protein
VRGFQRERLLINQRVERDAHVDADAHRVEEVLVVHERLSQRAQAHRDGVQIAVPACLVARHELNQPVQHQRLDDLEARVQDEQQVDAKILAEELLGQR